ncbi:hypothetical protein [Neobacillus sp. YIM B06451]|uniref:hypothetical protein n=1 Tax=Neobacillus sp. YIM B06451 TaxID=3070994 RepID=UPI0029303E46|nr:hypothetical protein [Neobacillus sp. YIM B06451]
MIFSRLRKAKENLKTKYKCLDCGNYLKEGETLRCKSCLGYSNAKSIKLSPYLIEETKTRYKCLDCGNYLKEGETLRCKPCLEYPEVSHSLDKTIESYIQTYIRNSMNTDTRYILTTTTKNLYIAVTEDGRRLEILTNGNGISVTKETKQDNPPIKKMENKTFIPPRKKEISTSKSL